MRPIAYVAGPYTAKTDEQIKANIAAADKVGRELLAMGYAPFIPHNNTAGWENDGRFGLAHFLDADMSMLQHAAIVVLVGEWVNSTGTVMEVEFARQNGITIYADISTVPHVSELQLDTTDRAIELLRDRRRKGIAEYGVPLMPFNGRDSLQDATEEAGDLVCYVVNYIIELGDRLEKAGI